MRLKVFSALVMFVSAPFTSAQNSPAITKSQSVFVCGHSFHIFLPKPLEALAKEAGFADHKTVGLSSIGNSRPIQHWDLPDAQNSAKQALLTGKVDVLTLAAHTVMPEEGIDRFADFAFAHNPDVRVMVQLSWPTEPLSPKADWQQIPVKLQAYLELARQQALAINQRNGRNFVTLVPVATAYLRLREKILAGEIPGIANFSQLFTDELGHPAPALQNLVSFCWFAAIYRQSPEGLTALDSPATPVSREINQVLQKIAWDAVSQEPMAGIKAL